jgi:hypothetical protein
MAAGFAAYNLGRGVLHTRALATLDSRLYQEATAQRVAALPNAANPLAWKGLVETPDFYAVVDLNLARDFDPGEATIFHKPEASPLIDAARSAPGFREFLSFSQYPLWRVLPATEVEGAHKVEAMDLRFGNPLSPAFVATGLFDRNLRPLRTWFSF